MKGVDTIARIRGEPFVRGKTIKEIVRDRHVPRRKVRKILRSGATAPALLDRLKAAVGGGNSPLSCSSAPAAANAPGSD